MTLTGRVDLMTKGEAKKRGPRRGRGSIARNRARIWQVRYTDPYGKRRAGGTYRLKGDADQQLAKILASIENNTWREIDNTVSGDLNPKTITLRQASIRYCKGRPNKNGQARNDYTTAEYARLMDKVLTRLAYKPLRSIRRDDVNSWWAEVSERTSTQAYMLEIFGSDFSPSSPVWEPKRFDASDEAVTAQDLSSQVVTSARNGGLLIELPYYPFSAPVFSFGAATSATPDSSGGSSVPGIFLTVAGHAGRDVQGSPIYYGAERVALESSYLLTITPVGVGSLSNRLSEGTIETNGSFSDVVRLPALRDGSHEIQLPGRHRNGATLELTATVLVRDGKIVSVGPNVPKIR